MRSKDQLSVSEKLLIAARVLVEKGIKKFSAEDLVIAAWQNFPDVFGLKGYKDENGKLLYPDSNRVFAEIMGSKPIRQKGYLKKVGNKLYQLTETGYETAKQLLLEKKRSGGTEKAGIGRELQEKLERLFASKAYEKWVNGRFDDITFHDACALWGISPRSTSIELEGQIANFKGVITSIRPHLQGKKVSFQHGGQVSNIEDLDKLEQLHGNLMRKFQPEIEIIMKRLHQR